MAKSDLPEEFQFESGLPDHLEGETIDAVFGYDEESFDPDRLNLDLTFRDADGEEFMFRYPVNGFVTTDDGETCEREDGTDRRFHKNSGPALLVSSMIENGGQEVLERRLEDGLTPRHAAFYRNLNMKLFREEFSGEIDGETRTWDRMLCEEFYGETGAKKSAKKAAGKKAASKKAGAKKAAPKKKAASKKVEEEDAGDEGGLDADTLAALDAIADDSETHDEFMSRVLEEVEGADSDDDVLTAISEDETVEGSIWARAIERVEE